MHYQVKNNWRKRKLILKKNVFFIFLILWKNSTFLHSPDAFELSNSEYANYLFKCTCICDFLFFKSVKKKIKY